MELKRCITSCPSLRDANTTVRKIERVKVSVVLWLTYKTSDVSEGTRAVSDWFAVPHLFQYNQSFVCVQEKYNTSLTHSATKKRLSSVEMSRQKLSKKYSQVLAWRTFLFHLRLFRFGLHWDRSMQVIGRFYCDFRWRLGLIHWFCFLERLY